MEQILSPIRKNTKDYLMQAIAKTLVDGMTQMAVARPKDPHLWMGKFLLSKTNDAACLVMKDGTVVEIKELPRDCSGSAVTVARALRGGGNNKDLDEPTLKESNDKQQEKQKAAEQGEEIEKIKQSNAVLLQTIQNLQEQINEYKANRWQDQIDTLSCKLEASERALRDQILQQSETIEKLRGIVSPNSFNTIILQEPKFTAESFGHMQSESLDADVDVDESGEAGRVKLSNSIIFKGGKKLEGIYIMVAVYNDWSIRAYSRNHNQFFKVIGFPSSLDRVVCLKFLRSLGWFDLNGEYVLKSEGEGEGEGEGKQVVVEAGEGEVEIRTVEGGDRVPGPAGVEEGVEREVDGSTSTGDAAVTVVETADTGGGAGDASGGAVTIASSGGENHEIGDPSPSIEAATSTISEGEAPVVPDARSDAVSAESVREDSGESEPSDAVPPSQPLVEAAAGASSSSGTTAEPAPATVASATVPADAT